MIRLEHVSKTYQQGVPALNDVNIDIEQGEFVFIMGKSGSGKSTLIKLLLKELEPTEGEIYINEQKLSSVTHKKTPYFRRNIGVVFQNFRLLQDRNVYENVAFAMKVVESSTREVKRKVPLMLSLVGLAAKYKSRHASCPVVSSSALPLQEHWLMSQRSFWQMSRQETWTIPMHGRSCIYWRRSMSVERPLWW